MQANDINIDLSVDNETRSYGCFYGSCGKKKLKAPYDFFRHLVNAHDLEFKIKPNFTTGRKSFEANQALLLK
jgi:hypothetical protein